MQKRMKHWGKEVKRIGKRMEIVLATCLFILLSSPLAFSATYYVRAGAAGNGTGTDWTNAYTQLPTVLDRGTNGSTYYFAAGRYEGYEFTSTSAPVDGTKVICIKKATVADHGTNTGWNDAYAAQAVFQYSENGGIIGGAKLATFRILTSYITIDGIYGSGKNRENYGFKLVMAPGFGEEDLQLRPWNGILVGGTGRKNLYLYDIQILHVAAIGPTDGGVRPPCIDRETGWLCTNSGIQTYFHALANSRLTGFVAKSNLAGQWNQNCDMIGVTNANVSDNYFYENHGSPTGSHGQNVNVDTSADLDFHNNVLVDSVGFILALHQNGGGTISNLKVFNNIIKGNLEPAGCITGMSADVDTITTGLQVHHNTLVDLSCGPKGFVNVAKTTHPDNTKSYVYNNLLYNVDTARVDTLGVEGAGIVIHDNNAYMNCTGTNNSSLEINPVITTGVDPDDLFVDYAGAHYQLKAGSLPIDKGKTGLGATYAYDMDGNLRDAHPDIGAYEYIPENGDATPPAAPANLSIK